MLTSHFSVDWAALDWENMGINWSSAYEAGQAAKTAAAAAPVATTAAAAAPATTTPATTVASSSGSSLVSDVADLWDGLIGLANDLTSFGEATASSGSDVDKIGNIGNAQGSNMIKVSSTEGYQYTNNFINTSGSKMTVVIWNKAFSTTGNAADAEANLGSCVAPKTPALTFVLAPGANQIVAFQEDSQVGWAQAVSAIAESGAFATSWGEANFCSTGSGYDLSAIMNAAGNNYKMAISSVEAPQCTSDMTQNFWLTASDPVGDSNGSCYIAQSTATLTTTMGGTV